MANIVELREKSNEALNKQIEDAREEMFNLRFQHASARLADISRIRAIRRELAQLLTVVNMRNLAIEAATRQPEIAESIAGKAWSGSAHFDYEESAWQVEILDEDEKELATTYVDLNRKRGKERKAQKK